MCLLYNDKLQTINTYKDNSCCDKYILRKVTYKMQHYFDIEHNTRKKKNNVANFNERVLKMLDYQGFLNIVQY